MPRRNNAPTLREVAKAAGLSMSTVSRALAGNPMIPESTAAHVREVAEQLNYRPNAQARALRQATTNTIGVIIPTLLNPYFAQLAAAIQGAADAKGLCTVLSHSDDDPQQFLRAFEVLQSQRVDGIIAVPHLGTESALVSCSIPLVLVDREIEQDNRNCPGAPLVSVSSDPIPGMTAALDLLCSQGHRRIGYLAGPMDTSTGQQRKAAFIACMANHPDTEHHIYQGGYLEEEGYKGTQWLLEHNVSAIIAGDSMMTTGALRACHTLGIAIGPQLALIGFDDFPLFNLQAVPLSVIDQQVELMGRLAFRALESLIRPSPGQPPDQPEAIKMATVLRPRASTSYVPHTHFP